MPLRDEALARAVVGATAYALIATRPDGVITLFNQAAERLLGWTAAELVGHETPGIFHEPAEVVARAAELSAELGRTVTPGFEVFVAIARDSGLPDEGSWTYIRKDQGRVPVVLSVTAIRDAEGALTGYLGVARDISDLRRAQRQVQEGEARFRAVFEAAVDGLFLIDDHGQILDLNPAAARLFGWAVPEMLGRNISMIMPPPVAAAHDGHLAHYRAGGEPRIIGRPREVEAQRRDGTRFPAELAVAEGRLAGQRVFVGCVRDISQRRQAEAAQLAAAEAAGAASRAKSDFLANMSHEIRTPLNGIVGMIALLLDSRLDTQQRDQAETVRACADNLLDLINDILDFSKIEAGKLEIEAVPFDPLAVCEEAAVLLADRAAAKGLELRLDAAPDLPRQVIGDPGRLRQVVVNLLSNAVKFTAAGEVELQVGWCADGAEGMELAVQVRDTGMGMDPAVIERLFQPFTQADASTTRRFGGTGLGLSICRRLVELMGGSISVGSTLGRGSSFAFTVRCRMGEPVPPPAALPALAGRRVLVVDDHPANRRLLTGLLDRWGLVAEEAADAPAAMEHARAALHAGTPFDLILSDQHMPGMDGLALARILAHDPQLGALPVVLLGSGVDRATYEAAIAGGVREVLSKPVRQTRLLECLGRIFIGSSAAIPARLPALAGRVLVVDDNPVNVRVATALCAKLGLTADGVADGHEAVAACTRGGYDLVLMDCQMPEMDGFTATRLIRDHERSAMTAPVPIIALTAQALSGDRERCLAAGMDDYIAKPIRFEDLRAACQRRLRVAPAEAVPAGVEAGKGTTLDPSALDGLRRELGDQAGEVIGDLLQGFRAEAPGLAAALAAAADAEALARTAHRLRGSALTLGALALGERCRAIEAAARAGDLATARTSALGVPAALDDVLHALE